MRAKDLYNSNVFPPCMIIQIVRFLAEAFLKVFSCVLWIDYSFGYMCSTRSYLIFKLSKIDNTSRLWYFALVYCLIRLIYSQIFYIGLRARFEENLQNFYMVLKLSSSKL